MEYQILTLILLATTFIILFVNYYSKYTKVKGQIEEMRINYGEIIRLHESNL